MIRKIFKNIKINLLLWYLFTIALILFGFSYTLIYSFDKNHTKHTDIQLKAVLNDIKSDFRECRDKDSYGEVDEGEEFHIEPFYAYILVVKDNKVKISGESPHLKDGVLPIDINLYSKLEKGKIHFFGNSSDLRIALLKIETIDGADYIAEVATILDREPIEDLNFLLLILNPIILILSIFGGVFFIQKALNPVKKIVDSVQKIEANDLSKRIEPIGSGDELDRLITTFNTMLERLEDSFTNIKRFSQNASHELKTPLTIIRGEIEVGLRKNRDSKEYQDILNSALDETKFLQNSIDNLLFLATANKNEIKKSFKDVYLDEIISESIVEKKKLAKLKNITLKIEELEPLTIRANAALIKIAINNILDNAIKYSYRDKIVKISLKESILSIKNEGEVISKEDLPFVFDRFYRVRDNNEVSGNGLGLSIVKSIIDIHEFDVLIKSELPYTLVELDFK